ncbi:tetratricopeptide repeat protein [Erythrobacter sp. AP23]|uniref:tetratricopeptide repeat protein n=1 Tax=Erythrobacter sp. AP23 TaxID=499656 RepID=UPI00076DDFD2|nr:tetratricopeptide repeat protein [Erythrobacter sp. AP23]KWV95855.1 hypothetical protein ASS64_01070 [Erythrobacter sp. AP23]
MISRRDLKLIAALALALAALGGCEETVPDRPAVESARIELARGDFLAAQVFLDRALDEGTPREELAALLGEAALLAGNLQVAREWLAPGEFSEQTRARGFRLLGRLEMAEGNLPAAGAAFDQSYRVRPDNAELWVDIGRLRYRGGEQLEAIEAAERALAIDPDNGEALRFRGQLARDAEGLIKGAELLGRALESQPDNIDLRVEYAATLGDAGRADEALQVLREEDGSAAATPRGLFVQAVIAARGGQFRLSRNLLTKSGLQRDDLASAHLLSAIIDLQKGNYASAAQALDRLYTRQPDNARIRDLLAFALSRDGGERELVYRFATTASSGSGSAYLRTLVGRAYEALGNRERAAMFLDLAAIGQANLSVLPSMTPYELLAISGSGNGGGLETRDYVRSAIAGREAVAAVRRARDFAKRFPGSADAQAILGDAEFARGNKRAAREAYARSARVRRPWPLALRLAGAQDSPESARELLEDYVRDNPMNGEAAAILADALAAEGDWERAIRLLDHSMGLGMVRVPWVLAARSVGALQLDDRETALDFALAAHDLQPMNPLAISALIAALPEREEAARRELEAKLRSLGTG